MKQWTRRLLTIMVTAICCSILLLHSTARAEETRKASRIEITNLPTKTTYTYGQKLNILDMTVTGFYSDGTNEILTDYTVEGYESNRIGTQTITIAYQGATTSFTVRVLPPKVMKVSASSGSTTSITLTWDKIPGIKGYEIYSRDEVTNTFQLATFSETNKVSFEYAPGSIQSYYICAVAEIDGVTYTGELSDKVTAATGPEAVTGLTVTETTTSSVSLTWNEVAGANGYLVYRSAASSNNFTRVGITNGTNYTDKTVAPGTAYRYKVSAYVLDPTYSGTPSDTVEATTKLNRVNLRVKAGDQKVRLTWNKVNGATFYDIYIGDEATGEFNLLTTRGSSTLNYTVMGLTTGNTYSFYAIARRNNNGTKEESPASAIRTVTLAEIEATSTKAMLFEGKEEFEASSAYNDIEFFRENVVYNKSYIIPGLINTNIGGFTSTAMCPQGLTFAGDYLLMTAYDLADEENSVIYVIDKVSQNLLATLILPTYAHVGGIAYDGAYIWVTVGTRVSAIPYEVIQEAAESGDHYTYVDFVSECRLGITASYITYFDNMLWVGSYNELQSTTMYSYRIDYEMEEVPTLKRVGSITMPTRVQGIAFTKKGDLIISRSCQLYQGLRGYMRQIDIYKPDLTDSNGKYRLGDLVHTIEMPSMNEGIAIDGSYLYVNFESAAFNNASYRVDRISAFKLSRIIK